MIAKVILHVITGLQHGGAEAVLLRLVAHDVQKGNQHHVISLMDRGIQAVQLEREGATVYHLNFSKDRLNLIGLVKLLYLVRRIQPDVVQTWMYHSDLIGGLVARLAGVRSVVWGIRHANLDSAHNRKSTLLVARLCAKLSNIVPYKIISCSAEATSLHQAFGYCPDKFVQVPNGYNMNLFKPDVLSRIDVRVSLGINSSVFVLGMVARFDIQKDHKNLLQALNKLKHSGVEFVCLLAGFGMDSANSQLRDWIADAELVDHILLLGVRGDVPSIMNALDLHVLSSLGEAFPNVLAEAMACGTPCVTTEVGDAAAIVGECGWVVPSQNFDALAHGLLEAYKSFINNKDDWRKRQIACRSRIMVNFELKQMCLRYRQVWESFL